MQQDIRHIALVVDDYDEAIEFYTEKLQFTVIEDTVLSETKRWVRIAPRARLRFLYCWQKHPVRNNKAG